MSANDIYNAIVDGDSYGSIRPLVEEMEAGAMYLADDERTFLNGIRVNMELDAPITPGNIQQLRVLYKTYQERLRTAGYR